MDIKEVRKGDIVKDISFNDYHVVTSKTDSKIDIAALNNGHQEVKNSFELSLSKSPDLFAYFAFQ